MKKFFVVFFLASLFISVFSQTYYEMGFSLLNYPDGFKFALRSGLESDSFNFDFDLSPTFENKTLSLTMISDISAKILDINPNAFLDVGLLWVYGEEFPGTFAYGGFNFNFNNILGKLYVGYPFNATEDLLNYFAIKLGYVVPKPADFVDDLKLELRVVNGRIHFSIFLVEPL
ncbi:hypothetical protein HWHPT5561_01195 [Petrotoga sp. HWH.PT.55.6.1]|uniref:hypothetical protein n=1 Tax=unclassified Petrotoga TaxID=2620614 RepID=UPI000CA00325|nr:MULTISPECIES: hypothetical protein [unclassified Petrotoga]PNR89331.1 hypothetical protein X925_03540 [Petrotoga sp. 9T1HF07.CasAA.8.2]PNR93844.1 hypothetical protein X926_01870 [Petrotoga sp. HWHPT.55.6.3]RPD36465.1 hypothetical protein HWHPT5561_01195 [Petrotoga sp. HWH.PT.55.6.1]